MDNDMNARLSAGDRVVVTYTDCDQTRGTIELAITQISIDAGSVTSVTGSVTLHIEFLDQVNLVMDGSGTLTYTASASQLRWLGTGFAINLHNTNQSEKLLSGRIEKTISAPNLDYALTISGTIDSDGLGGTFTFTTTQPLTGIEGSWPMAGQLIATGRSSSKINFGPAAGQAMVSYQIDADGNGSYEVAAISVPWDQISSGLLFGIYDQPGDPGDPPPPPPVDVLGRRVALGAPAEDLEVDAARGRIYVTLPDRNELVVLSAQTLAVQQRLLVGSRPQQMSLSLDGQELYIALGAAGEFTILNLNTLARTQAFVAPALNGSNIFNVVETSPGVLFVSTGSSQWGSVGRLDRSTGALSTINIFGSNWGRIELLADPARGLLYIGDGFGIIPQSLYKLDATNPLAPVLLEDQHGSVGGTQRISLSPSGTRVYLSSGQVLNTADFTEIGRIMHGVPWAVDNGVDVMVGEGTGTLHIHAASDLHEVDALTTDCDLQTSNIHLFPDIIRIAPSAVNGQWLLLGGSVLCAIDLNNPRQPPGSGQAGIPPGSPPVLNVPVIDLPLGADAYDAEFDLSRNRIYVSLPATGEVVTVDAATHQISNRDALGNAPRGLDLSPDESRLSVVFNGNGHIGFKDLTSGLTQTRDLTSFLFSPQGHDVAYVNDDAIFVSADQPGGEAYLVKTSWLNPAATLRVPGGEYLRDKPELAASPDGHFLFITERDQDLFKLDLSNPNASMNRQIVNGEFGNDRISVSPDSTRFALRGGQVMRAADYTQAGQFGAGIPRYAGNGSILYSASAPGRIDRYDAQTFVPTETIQGNCSIGQPRRLLTNASENTLISVGQSRLCFWFLGGQITSTVKIGPQSPYVCGSECLVRKHLRRTGGGFGAFRPRLFP
jgi:uncharacterized protein (AIM24 family)